MKFTIYQNSRQGPRASNQDRIAYCYSKDAILAVVADGMGGHLHGEIAAEFAVTRLSEAFQRQAQPILADPQRFLQEHILVVHEAIGEEARAHNWPDCPRTTLVAAVMQHDALYCAHVGDSRLYHLRDGRILFRTEDHSKVRLMYRKGLISKDQLRSHPERNKVYNCVGGDTLPQVELAAPRVLRGGDAVLLCTDGLWSLLGSAEIAAALAQGAVTDTVPPLLDLAESRADQHGDNLSVIALNWETPAGSDVLSTATMPLDLVTTIVGQLEASPEASVRLGAVPDLSDEEIENSIAEIQAAIRKVPNKKPSK
jgi:PPM family protein phosphatase